MTATIIDMDYRLVDVLNADQLEIDDLIGLNEDIVKVISIASTKTGFELEIENEFGERDTIEIADEEQFELFILE